MAKDININKKKRDTGINAGEVTGSIRQSKDRNGQQAEATAEEKAERESQLRTKGRKGCRLERLNLSISPENIQFVKTMSAVMGRTSSEFVNFVLDQYRAENAGDYETARDIVDRLTNSKLAAQGKVKK